MRHIQRFVMLAFFFLPFLTKANDPFYIHYKTQDGLPSNEVYAAALDTNGLPWFCTDRGVCSYNGYTFTTYTTRDGLSNNTCLEVETAADGSLWFLALDGTLSSLSSQGIRSFPRNQEMLKLAGPNAIPASFSLGPQGKIATWYIAKRSIRILVYHPSTGQFTDETERSAQYRRPVRQGGGISFFDYFGRQVATIRVAESLIDARQNLFVCPFTERNVLLRYAHNTGDSSKVILPTNVNDLYVDQQGDLWVPTNAGAYRFPQGDLSADPDHFFHEVSISSILQDREGNYWLTSLENGIFRVPTFDIRNLDFTTEPAESKKVTALAGLPDRMIFSTQSGGIYSVDHELQVHKFSHDKRDFGRLAFASIREDQVILGGWKLRERAGKLTKQQVPQYRLEQVVVQCADSMYFYGDGWGFNFSDPMIKAPPKYHGYGRIICAMSSGKQLWIGSLKGLYHTDQPGLNFPRKVLPDSELLSTRVNYIEEDGYGNLWISTIGNGLLHLRDSTLTQVAFGQGLNSDLVNKTALERPGVLWVASNKGLSRIAYSLSGSLQIQEIRNFNAEDGLPDNFILDVAVWQDEVWLATNNGLAHFPLHAIEAWLQAPEVPIVLESVMVNNVLIDPETETDFAHDNNDLAFRFLGAAHRKPKGKPFYRYALLEAGWENEKPADLPWIYTNERQVRYLNLAPGAYTFAVSASNRTGHWSQPYHYAFVVQPHFSQTLTFRVLVILGILLVVVSILYYFWWRYRQRQEERRTLQEARLRAQEAEISVLRSQMNPHFVFNALNSIQNFIFKKDVLKANHFLSRFSRLIRDGLRFSRQSLIPLAEELAFLRAYLELEAMRFPDRFAYTVEVDPVLDPARMQIPPFLFQPLLENAVKHAFKDIDYQGELAVRFRAKSAGWLEVEIQDNGSGFSPGTPPDPGNKQKSLGLQIVRDRIDLLKAETANGAVSFELRHLHHEGGQGILARIIIPIQS